MSYYCVRDRKEMEANGRTESTRNKKNVLKKIQETQKKHKSLKLNKRKKNPT